MGKFEREVRRFRWLHPFLWWKVSRELEVEQRIYRAVAGVLKAHGIPDERGPEYEDEPSYDLMVAVMRVLRREKVKL